MGTCIVKKLQLYADLSEDDKKLLMALQEEEEDFKAGEIIRKKGENSDHIYVVKHGWAYLSLTIDKDIRSIFDLKMDGDFVGINELSFNESLYDLVALTNVTVCPFPRKNLDIIFGKSRTLSRAFYSILSRQQALIYERIVSLGRRTALEKVAHLILEIALRYGNGIGIDASEKIDFPIRQEHLGDLLGLSSVHINRSMNELKRHGYITYDRNSLQLLDLDRLFNLANFNPLFLEKPFQDWIDKG